MVNPKLTIWSMAIIALASCYVTLTYIKLQYAGLFFLALSMYLIGKSHQTIIYSSSKDGEEINIGKLRAQEQDSVNSDPALNQVSFENVTPY